MIERKNDDGSTTWMPLDPCNSDYRAELVNRIKDVKFATDESFLTALQEEHHQNQTLEAKATENLPETAEVRATLAAKLKSAIKGLTLEEAEWLTR
jgi:hypothetical protein